MPRSAWYKFPPDTLPKLRAELEQRYPTLHLFERAGFIELLGSFPIEHGGIEIDRFKIQILLPPDFPKAPPFVWETAGRIPKILDRHIYPASGNCCFFYPDEYRLRHPDGMSFFDFIQGPMRDYFLGQLAVEAGQPWPFGQRAHGKDGAFEFYEEFFGVKGKEIVLNYLKCLAYETLKGHQWCPCGSGRRLRNCHMTELSQLRKRVPIDIAGGAFKRLGEPTASVKRP